MNSPLEDVNSSLRQTHGSNGQIGQPQSWQEIKQLIEPWFFHNRFSLVFIFKLLVERHFTVVSIAALKKRITQWNWTFPERPELSEHIDDLPYRRDSYAVLRIDKATGHLKVDIYNKEGVRALMSDLSTKPTASVTPAAPPPALPPATQKPAERKDTQDSGYISSTDKHISAASSRTTSGRILSPSKKHSLRRGRGAAGAVPAHIEKGTPATSATSLLGRSARISSPVVGVEHEEQAPSESSNSEKVPVREMAGLSLIRSVS